MTASHSSSVIENSIRSRRMPALLTSTSRPPNVSTASCTIAVGVGERTDVADVGDGLAAGGGDLVDDLLRRTDVAAGAVAAAAEVVDHDLGTLVGQHQGVLTADAAPGSGHDAHSSFTHLVCHERDCTRRGSNSESRTDDTVK